MLDRREVSLYLGRGVAYPEQPPFNPPDNYPELSRLHYPLPTDPTNQVYMAVRECFKLLGLDRERYGTHEWNPLQSIVRPGDRVIVKPNWVIHEHPETRSWEQLVTHGSVIRAVLDYVQLALKGRGTVTVADGPMLNANFDMICERTGIPQIRAWYRSVPTMAPVELLDLRPLLFETCDDVIVRRQQVLGDPRGSVVLNLGRQSALYRFCGEGRYYGADYNTAEVNRHHCGEVQEYQLSGTAMAADVIIDVPKLKSHHKVGVTLSLKGIVGLNCGRNWLPHRTQGTPEQGGDQFEVSGFRQLAESVVVQAFEGASLRFPRSVPPIHRLAKRIGKRIFGDSRETVRGGGWHGNDTLWRMVHDINRALMYGDATGEIWQRIRKRRFCVVDGIVAGEGMGPTRADPIACGVIVAGNNSVAVDVVATELMGFDFEKIRQIAEVFSEHTLPLVGFRPSEIIVRSNLCAWSGPLANLRAASPFAFKAPLGWIGHIERMAPNLSSRPD